MGRQELAPACSALRSLGELWGSQESEDTASDWSAVPDQLNLVSLSRQACLHSEGPKCLGMILEATLVCQGREGRMLFNRSCHNQ